MLPCSSFMHCIVFPACLYDFNVFLDVWHFFSLLLYGIMVGLSEKCILDMILISCMYFLFGSDNRLQLDAQICLNNKKKPCRKITGFQVCISIPSCASIAAFISVYFAFFIG